MFCLITQKDIINIEKWEKEISHISLNNLQKKILRRYEVNNKDEYIDLIKKNINDKIKINEINKLYKINRYNERLKELIEEHTKALDIIKNSYKYKDKHIKIRLLTNTYKLNAVDLYRKFKIIMDEQFDDDNDYEYYIDDFILKNQLYGLFEKNILAGIMILDIKKFNIYKTFYIQELIIDENFRNKGYGNLLINYAILRCPYDIDYISYLTMPSNTQMINIGKKFDFILQQYPSGDKKHSLLFIRPNDKVERDLYKNLGYFKSKSSGSPLPIIYLTPPSP
jgi:GNAT superfamily N-acetyltransferase